MENGDYITILAPMSSKLKLSGNNLLVFALIHGFSKDGEHAFYGSISYISSWLNISKNSVIDTLKVLTESGLLTKDEEIKNGVKFCNYKSQYDSILKKLDSGCEIAPVVAKKTRGGAKSQHGSCEIAPNNNKDIDININTNKEDKDKSLSKKDDLFEECWKTYKRKGSKSISQRYWKKLSETEKANVQKHIPYYIKSVDNIKYIKDFERYLRDKIFESVVYKNGSIIYDPERIMDDNLYHPITDKLGVFWSDNTKCYISSNMLGTQMFQDGYTNENRPNNSIIMYQGTRFHWNSEIKRWEENK